MEISLSLKGPLLTQSSNPGELGLDAVIARHHDKTPYLPGTLIAGKLRQALEELQSVVNQDKEKVDWFQPELDNWLGQASKPDNLPSTKQLFFSDFDLKKGALDWGNIRERIAMDEKTEAVKKHQIVMVENPFISGGQYIFCGKLHFFAPADKVDNILRHVKTGFNWFSQLGGLKSIGFGQVVAVDFKKPQLHSIKKPSANPMLAKTRIGITLKPDYPFCIAVKPVPGRNFFDASPIIPGGAIIGAIATTWNHLTGNPGSRISGEIDGDRKELSKNFSKLRITHAFPSSVDKKRPVVAPLSLTRIYDDNNLYDVAQVSRPCLINRKPPDFALDWKDSEDDEYTTLKEYPWPFIRMQEWGWARLQTEMRVRTGMDRDKYRSQKKHLFAYEQIIPDNRQWYAELDLSRITDDDERAGTLAQLESLLEYGIIGLSKTKTPAQIEFDRENDIESLFATNETMTPKPGPQWIITLQTDALIGSPESLDETSGADELRTMYEKSWLELSGGNLKLVCCYFARQKLSGGEHRWIVFQGKEKPYRPWLLTEGGSVFVLQATGDAEKARAEIDKWQQQGLPLTANTLKYYRITDDITRQWQDCPFIPQNGYGEIAVNIRAGGRVRELNDDSPEVVLIDRVEVKR